MSQTKKCPSFCPFCGSILSRPGPFDEFVKCCDTDCTFKFPARELDGTVVLHKKIKLPKRKKFQEVDDTQGPTMTITCANCGVTEARYFTKQLRSADEGQTIFYKCLTCGKETKEDS